MWFNSHCSYCSKVIWKAWKTSADFLATSWLGPRSICRLVLWPGSELVGVTACWCKCCLVVVWWLVHKGLFVWELLAGVCKHSLARNLVCWCLLRYWFSGWCSHKVALHVQLVFLHTRLGRACASSRRLETPKAKRANGNEMFDMSFAKWWLDHMLWC